jgi:tetratricopeptide (TPR) repeat protein
MMTHEFEDLREELYEAAIFAGDTEQEYLKNLFKTFLGKVFYEAQQAKHAVSIYNEQVTYFANNKLALGALVAWYLIAQATMITENPKNAIEIASQALEIAQNPKINNAFFIVQLKILLAKAYNELADYETAKINLESAMILAKKYNMNDLMSKIYLNYGMYYQDMAQIPSLNKLEFLKGAKKMYEKAMTLILKNTKNVYLKEKIDAQNAQLQLFCQENGFEI